MQRIATPNAVGGLFVEALGSQGRTLVSAEWLNAVQEELATFIEAQSIVLDRFDLTQFRTALVDLIVQEASRQGVVNAFDTFTAQESVVVGQGTYLVGGPDSTGIFTVATEAASVGQSFLGQLKGNATLPKDATPGQTTFAVGQVAYWDLVSKNVHDNGGVDRRIIGYSREDRVDTDTTVELRLNGNSEAP